MIALSREHVEHVRPRNRRPLQRLSGLFTKKRLAKSQPVNVDKNPLQVETTDSTSEKDGIDVGLALRNEKIEKARSLASAARRQRQQITANSANMHTALLERLEAKLLAYEMECTELRELVEVRRISLPVPSLDFPSENTSSVSNIQLLEKLEVLLLAREKECTKVRKLLVQATKRGESRTQKGTSNRISLAAHLEAPNLALRKQNSARSKKSQKSARSTKSVSWDCCSQLT
jgi:hypothetical protein